MKYYDLIKPTRCLIEENQRYLKIQQEDGTVYAAYFTINSIVGNWTSHPRKSFTINSSNSLFPIDTSMNVEIVTNRKAPLHGAEQEKELKDLDKPRMAE